MGEIHRVDRLEDLPEEPPAATYVVIDVIISSTSIVQLLESGAAFVRPFRTIDAALSFKQDHDDAVLVGEEGGGAIDGFDLSPLPSILSQADLDGRPVGIRTSNGTRAIDSLGDRDVLVGTTINAAAVADELRTREGDIWLVAAGRRGSPTPEDTAGARLIEAAYEGNLTSETCEKLFEDVRTSTTADWLRSIGYEHEVDALQSVDASEVVPRLQDGVLVPA